MFKDRVLPRRDRIRRDLIPVTQISIDPTPVKVTVGEPVQTVLSCPVETVGFREVVEVVCVGAIPVPVSFTVPVIEVFQTPPVLITLPTARICPVVSPILQIKDKGKHC